MSTVEGPLVRLILTVAHVCLNTFPKSLSRAPHRIGSLVCCEAGSLERFAEMQKYLHHL